MRYRVIDGKLAKVDEDEAPPLTTFTRRRFLEASFLAVGATALAACGIPGFNASGTTNQSGSRVSTGSGTGGGWFGVSGSGGGGGGHISSSGGGGS